MKSRSTPCELSVLLVSYNTRELSLECLESLTAHTSDVDLEVIVVDNASSDGSAEAIGAAHPEIRVIRSPDNLGFAAANNLAAEEAAGEYLLLLNTDTLLLDDAVSESLSVLRADAGIGAVGARTLYADGTLNSTSCFALPSLWGGFCIATGLSVACSGSKLFNPEEYGGWQRDTRRDVGVITGCYLMLRRSLWEELGGLDERFFIYSEDTDISARIQQRGLRCVHDPRATIIHHGGRSEQIRAEKMVKVYRGRAQFMAKHWHPLASALGTAMISLSVALRILAHWVLCTAPSRDPSKLEMWRDVWRSRRRWRASAVRFLSTTSAHANLAPQNGGSPT